MNVYQRYNPISNQLLKVTVFVILVAGTTSCSPSLPAGSAGTKIIFEQLSQKTKKLNTELKKIKNSKLSYERSVEVVGLYNSYNEEVKELQGTLDSMNLKSPHLHKAESLKYILQMENYFSEKLGEAYHSNLESSDATRLLDIEDLTKKYRYEQVRLFKEYLSTPY